MKYLGSKNRIGKHILPIMLYDAIEAGRNTWVEPFVGGGNMIDKVPPVFNLVGSDANPHTIAALIGIRDHLHELPRHVTEEEFRSFFGLPPDPVGSWVRYVCSFAGIFENGYARAAGRDFAAEGFRNAEKQSPNLQNVELLVGGYEIHSGVRNALIYCDPPYAGTFGYKGVARFDHGAFFDWCRRMAEHNTVYVSEYTAPDDFIEVWSGEIKTNFASGRTGATHNAVEKLFRVCTYI